MQAEKIPFLVNCVECGKTVEIEFSERDLDGYERRFMFGERILIQEALPDVPRELREMFLSGLCPDCWESVFGKGEEV